MFCDDPHARAIAQVVGAEETVAMLQTPFVLQGIFDVQLSPVASVVSC